jgi:uncharacterized repeat protein (TIGR03803 family)
MLYLSAFIDNGIKATAKRFTGLLLLIIFLIAAPFSKAQDTFLGLTSNGGPEGRGTAFSIKSTGANFTITKAFADWGKNPNGDLVQGADGDFYGMTYTGGTYTYGSIFKVTSLGVITILHQFNSTPDGANPYGELTKGSDGNFYGMTSSGGTGGYGTIFKITPAGIFTVLKHLVSADGINPHGHLVLGTDGDFYGCTYRGGAFGYGTIFKITSAGILTVLRSLNNVPDGGYCYGSLVQGSDGFFYGITYQGGVANGGGTIFKINSTGATFTVLRNMVIASDGGQSQGDLIQATDGNFYGMTNTGGTNFSGTIFKITSVGSFTVLRNLASADGSGPYGALVQATDGLLYGMCTGGGDHSNGTTFKISTTGTFTKLFSFTTATDGGSPKGSLVQSTDGKLYGMTSTGGSSTFGSVFKITTTGVFTFLNSFNGSLEGNAPYESLLQSPIDNAYYGTTSAGGVFGYGVVFKICGGTYTVLHSFNRNVDGAIPKGSLVLGTDSIFYGMTSDGGTNGTGTIFKITSAGTYTVLRHLSGNDGAYPKGSLLLGTDGNFYGMTNSGGVNGGGTIFKMTKTGTLTVLRALLSATDGANPEGDLTLGADGNFYGMTSAAGRIFKITPTGTFTPLHTFAGNDGSLPLGSLILASDGNFYGTANNGGVNTGGTIFKVTSAGTYTVLRALTPATDGSAPKGSLLQGTDGNLYGMTSAGGTNAAGTLFKITTGGTYTVLRHLNLAPDGGSPLGSLIRTVNNLIANPQTVTLKEDTTKKITLTGSGGAPLVFTVSTKPKHGNVTGAGATKTYKPKANYYGKDSFYFIVTVGCLSSAPAKVNITVTAVNDAPVLAPIGNKSVVRNTTLTFTAAATDVDKNNTLSFSLIGAPAGASIGATSGIFTWTPANTGNFTFTVRVTDNGSPQLYDEEQITVTVTASLAATVVTNKSVDATLSPNPVESKFAVTLDIPVDRISVTITDLKGFVFIRSELQIAGKKSFELDVAQLKPGAYFLQLQTTEGNKTFSFMKL